MSFTQQPLLQFAGEHADSQVNVVVSQRSFALQLVHCVPGWPQRPVSRANGTQASPAQHPFGHVLMSQAPTRWQVRAFGWPSGTQDESPAHWLQLWPKAPQAKSFVPSRHWPLSLQQPAQFAGPHETVPMHWPPPALVSWQTWPEPHEPHWPPLLPHAKLELPGRHWSPTQQPEQFDASHFAVPQWRWTMSHAVPESSQSTHDCPLVPHAPLLAPSEHSALPDASVWQQPSAQVAALQLTTVFTHWRALLQA